MSSERPSIYGASLAELCAYTSEETAQRAADAEVAAASLDAERRAGDHRYERMWRALRVALARALAAPVPARPTARAPLPTDYNIVHADGQRAAFQAVAEGMRDAEEGT